MGKFKLTLDLDLTQGLVSKGTHMAKCINVDKKRAKANDSDNLVFTFEILTPGEKGRQVMLYQSLKESVRWRYSQVLIAFGVSGSTVDVTEKTFEGKTVLLIIDHDDYNGETRASITKVLPAKESEVTKVGTAPKGAKLPKAGKKAKKVVEEEEEDDEDEEDEEDEDAVEDDEDTDGDEDEDEDEEDEDEEDEEDEDEDEDEEDEPAPKKGKAAKASKKGKKSAEKSNRLPF